MPEAGGGRGEVDEAARRLYVGLRLVLEAAHPAPSPCIPLSPTRARGGEERRSGAESGAPALPVGLEPSSRRGKAPITPSLP